jgi:MoxR-like ATPase
MEERQVTVDGVTYQLPRPFMVVATQNPIEHEGTYPLPVSQLDRFLMRLRLGYPDPAAEVDLLERHGVVEPLADLGPVCEPDDVLDLALRVRQVHCSDAVKRYIVDVANATRTHPSVLLGMSPRAALALQLSARAWAVLHGRDYVVPDDVKTLALPVVGHRLELRAARSMSATDQVATVVNEVLAKVPVLEGQPSGH